MQASYLCEVALEFELKIRGLKFEGVTQAQRILRRALIVESIGIEEKPPNPQFDPRKEWNEAKTYFEGLEEQSRMRSFRPKGFAHLRVYSQLCHLEKRISYVKWRKVEDLETRELFKTLAKQVAVFRALHYPDYDRYIVEDEQEISFTAQPSLPVWTDENEKMLKEVEAKLERLKRKKANASLEAAANEMGNFEKVQDVAMKDQRESPVLSSQERNNSSNMEEALCNSVHRKFDPKFSPSSSKKRAADENRGMRWKRKRLKRSKVSARLNSRSRNKKKLRRLEDTQFFAAKEFRQRFKISFKTPQEADNKHAAGEVTNWHASLTRLKPSRNCFRVIAKLRNNSQ
jgi:hypothetical protein